MKKFIFLVLILAAGYLAYTSFFQSSAEENLVRSLEKEFQTATQNYLAAHRQAAEPGLVILSEPEKAENLVKEVRKKLQELKPNLSEEKALARAQELENRIKNFCQKNDIE